MNDVSKTIHWADYSWNPLTGCSHSGSPGCDHCYAEAMAKRFKKPWGRPIFHAERLTEPYDIKKPAYIFTCSTSDLFHPQVSDTERRAIFDAISECQRHTFLVLTKRPEFFQLYFNHAVCPLNCWLGVTCENQTWADKRWPILANTKCEKRFVSVEPLLGYINFQLFSEKPDWIIAGPENGRGARPLLPDAIERLARQCEAGHIPFWDKSDNPIRRERP